MRKPQALLPGILAGSATLATLALLGRGSGRGAWAPINASSHVLWGEGAAVRGADLRHTLPGVAINVGASFWWAGVMRRLFGRWLGGAGAAAATAALAVLLDYSLLPRRLSPGWELALPKRGVAMAMVAMAAGLALGERLRR